MVKQALQLIFFSLSFFAHSNVVGKYWVEKNRADLKAQQARADLFNETIVNLAQVASPAVVTVLTTSEVRVPQQMFGEDIFEFFFGMPQNPRRQAPPRTRQAQSLGSGFVIHPDGLIITNSHVVRMGGDKTADSVRVKFLGDSSKSEGEEVEVVGVDPLVDTAILRLKKKPKEPLSVLPLGNSDGLKVGEWVVAIGNPHGLSHTVTKGIISALGRDIIPEISADFIQTDASINQGNSGGPLINLAGEVIGVNTAIDPRGQGLGFAIPINTAKRVVKDILEKGRASHGYAGVSLYPNFDLDTAKSLGLKNADGALIEDVIPGQPADKAGLKAYDVVIKVENRKISTNRDFQRAIREHNPGSKVRLEYLREGKPRQTEIVLGDLEKDIKLAQGSRAEQRGARRNRPVEPSQASKVGLVLTELTQELKLQWRLDRNIQGVVVSDVVSGSVAEQSGLTRGDIILEVQRKPVTNPKVVEQMLDKKGNHLIKLLRGNSVALFTLKNT